MPKATTIYFLVGIRAKVLAIFILTQPGLNAGALLVAVKN